MSKINPLGLLDYDEQPAERSGVNPLGLTVSERSYTSHGPRKHKPVEAEPVTPRAAEVSTTTLGRSVAGGRISIDRPDDAFFGNSLATFVTQNSEANIFRSEKFDARALARMPVSRLMELLADNSPEVSRALWDFLLFCNPGWKAKAFKPGTEEVDKQAQAALDEFLSNLHGPFAAPHVMPADVVIASLFMTLFMRGCVLAELVLDEAGRMPLEIATPDPITLQFRRGADPARGKVWLVGQQQGSDFVVLDRPTVCYVPLHPFPGSAQGRPIAASAIFSALFLIGMLYDLKRVVQQQGYPRLDIAIDVEKLKDLLEDDEAFSSFDKFNEVVDEITSQVAKHYASLQADDAYVHTTVVSVDMPVGAVDSRSLGAVDGLLRAIERMTVRALKSMPLLFGINEAVAETHANRQWEIHVAGIKSVQHLVEFVLERLCGLGLQARGIAAIVRFRFAELRAAEMLRDAQTEQTRINNAVRKRDEGFITQNEASQEITGKDAAAAGPVRETKSGSAGANVEPEPGSNR